MIGSDLTIDIVVMRLFAGLIIATVQCAAIAGTAVLLGDRGPRYDGRLTASPVPHVDMLGLGTMMLTGFGWGRPVAIEAEKLRFGRWGLVLAVLAGSLALLLAAFVLLLLVIPLQGLLPYTAALTMGAFLRVSALLCVWMALFGLLPIPPLAGAHFLAAAGLSISRRAGTYLAWVLVAASVFGVTRTLLMPAFELIAPLVVGVDLVH